MTRWIYWGPLGGEGENDPGVKGEERRGGCLDRILACSLHSRVAQRRKMLAAFCLKDPGLYPAYPGRDVGKKKKKDGPGPCDPGLSRRDSTHPTDSHLL